MNVIFFHRNKNAGFSINKVTQTIISNIPIRREFFVQYSGASICSIIKNLIYVWKHRDGNSINHITGDIHYCILALIGYKSVLTIHDTVSLDFVHLPQYKHFLIKWLWFKLPLKIATKVVCISEETRRHILKYTKRRDIEVIHNAIDPMFVHSPRVFCDAKPKVLLIGTGANKNLIRTFEAIEGLNCQVIIVGKLNDEHRIALDKYHIDYINKVGLSDEELLEEYINCDIVSFISLFEGFGMIVVEANKVGRPVICSDIPVLKEIGGSAALYVNPKDIDDMRRGFNKILSDEQLRNQLIMDGYENAKRFEVEIILGQWIRLYDSMR